MEMDFVGRAVKKTFQGLGTFSGIVDSYDPSSGFFKVLYEDGDSEELELVEVVPILQEAEESCLLEQIQEQRRGRNPKERCRGEEEAGSSSGNSMDTQMRESGFEKGFGGDGLKTLENLMGNDSDQVKGDCVGGDLTRNDGYLGTSEETQMKDFMEGDFKGNASFGAVEDGEMQVNGRAIENAYSGAGEDTQKKESGFEVDNCNADGSFDGNLKEDSLSGVVVEIQLKGSDSDKVLNENGFSGGVEVAQMEEFGFGRDCNGNINENDFSGVVEESQTKGSDYGGKLGGSDPLEVLENTDKEDSGFDGHLKGNVSFGGIEDAEMEDSHSDVVLIETLEMGGAVGSLDTEEHGPRKRRKLSEKLKSTPERSLRRSARRASSALLSSPSPVLDTDELPSVNYVSDGQCVGSDSRELEEQNHLPLKPSLPASSNNLNLDELPIFDIFSVYACLRSFSTVLFLSPFGLEAFVAALKCDFANSLIDSIHFSIMYALKLHLEFLSNEGSQSASDCLRSLNWELLDLITWPVYLAEYLLIRGLGLKPCFNLCHLKLLDGEYYRQSVGVKLEILRCLCDDVIEAEAIRLELNRRTMTSGLDIDTDRVVHLESYSKRKDSMKDLGSSCSTEEVVDEVADPNSDECRLCKMDGSLICCDGCPAAYHSRCVGITKDLLPEGDWYCPECMMDKHGGWMKPSKPLQGAELLGIDPHGRLYFGSCGYLLVSESCDSEPSYYYYNRNDLTTVIEVLRSSVTSYRGIITAISTYWGIPAHYTQVHFDHDTRIACMDLDVGYENHGTDLSCLPPAHSEQGRVEGVNIIGKEPKEDSVIHENSGFQSCKDSESVTRLQSPFVSSEGSAMLQAATCIPVSENTFLELKIPEKLHSLNEELDVKPADVDSTQEKHIDSAVHAPILVTNPIKQDVFQLPLEPGSYINYYSHGQMTSSVVEELTRRSSDKIKEDSTRPPEEVISAQLKAISKKSTKFPLWGIQKPYVDADKENCGWCFSCKNPSDRGCLFRLTDEKVPEGSKMFVGLRSNRNRKTHLSSVIYHILSIEDRLGGLLSGPWENPHHSKLWRKSILKASDVSSVKSLLLVLESNLRRIALSADWLKQVDSSVALGSGSHVFTSSVHVSSKHGVGKKRARKNASDAESNFLSNTATTSTIFWWRGGRLSRQVFNWKLLPRSLAFKCGRRAGSRKVSGIVYPDGSDFSKMSKYIAWRASVEMSTSVAQLGFHVRDLDSNIRWYDLGNSQLLHQLSKESKKLARLFKKVIIRRKCIEGSNVKYLLDFGKRKGIPDVVTKHGVIFEESANERKKFWLSESFVPLKLLKAYEEKKQARKANKTDSGLLFEEGGRTKKPRKKKGFLYLFSRAEKNKDNRCGHCNKDVIVREAVNCQFCKGVFHKKHARVSEGSITANRTYACFRCRDVKRVKVKTKTKGQKVQSKTPKLRRSQRAIKKVATYVPVQSKKLNGRKEGSKFQSDSNMSKTSKFPSKSGRSKKSRFQSKRETFKKSSSQSKREMSKKFNYDISWHKGQRTCVYHDYWLKGILWAKKPCAGREISFQERNILLPSQNSKDKQPLCCLCHEAYDSGLIYVSCESCEDWFHGDAFGLTGENSDKLLGFRCPNCLKRSTHVCPHTKDFALEAQQHNEENNGKGMECVGVPSEDNKLQRGMYEGQRSTENEDCSGIYNTGEPVCKKQRRDAILDSNETVLLENCTEKSEMGLVSVTPHDSHVEANPPSCKSDGEDAIQMEVVLKEHKLEDSLTGMSAIPELMAVATLELHPQAFLSSTHLLDAGGDKV